MGKENKRFYLVKVARVRDEEVEPLYPLDEPFGGLSSDNERRVKITRIIGEEAFRVENGIRGLEQRKHDLVSKITSKGRKSKREITQGRDNLQGEIFKQEEKLKILRGEKLGKIVVRLNEGVPPRVEDVDDLDPADSFWWNQVEQEEGLQQLLKENPKSFEIARQAVTLRVRSDQDKSLRNDYFDSIDSLEEDKIALGWTMRLVGKYSN